MNTDGSKYNESRDTTKYIGENIINIIGSHLFNILPTNTWIMGRLVYLFKQKLVEYLLKLLDKSNYTVYATMVQYTFTMEAWSQLPLLM